MNVTFSTSEVPRAQRLSSLREAVSRQFLGLHLAPLGRDADDFRGFMSIREFGGVRIARFCGTPVAAARTPAHVDASGGGYYLLALHLSGIARAGQRGRQITLRPGDLALLDSAYPYTIEFADAGEFEHIAYQIPRGRLDARSGEIERALGLCLTADSDPGRLASPYLSTLAAPNFRTPSARAIPLVETGLDLLVNALLLSAGVDAPTSGGDAGMLHQVKLHVRERLGEPELSPAAVADAHYMSTRQLHRLFARDGVTFGGWVREERLCCCRRDLADPRLRQVSIAELAARWGFGSAAYFTRAFSTRFGVGPRDFRRTALEHVVLAPQRPKH